MLSLFDVFDIFVSSVYAWIKKEIKSESASSTNDAKDDITQTENEHPTLASSTPEEISKRLQRERSRDA